MRRLTFITISLAVAIPLFVRTSASAQDAADQWVQPAKRLHASTVTLRVHCQSQEDERAASDRATAPDAHTKETARAQAPDEGQRPDAKASGAASKDCRRPCSVIVCSGVCVAKKKVITAVPINCDAKIRLTFPGGIQDDARVLVIDEFSGLVLLESPKCAAEPLEMSADLPEEGSAVMTAAAWGVEKPLVFQGMVSGTRHMLAGTCFPPLLVCQLPTTHTSTGSAIVDRQGKLVGIIVGADPAELHSGWMTYALPVSHVQRLLRACRESEEKGEIDAVVVLKRQRPKVGMVLENEEEAIVIKRIIEGGPAQKAGLAVGDRILAADDVQIRSVYQAWMPMMCKQPGDTLVYRIQRGEKTQEVTVELGGSVEPQSVPADKLGEIVQPKLEFGRDEKGGYYFKPFRPRSGEGKEGSRTEGDGADKPPPAFKEKSP